MTDYLSIADYRRNRLDADKLLMHLTEEKRKTEALEQRIRELEAIVERAYREGFIDGIDVVQPR